jgi:nucleoid DNA-binding protein
MSEKINLQDLVTLLAGKSEITKKEAEVFLREYLNIINEELLKDEIVKLKGLGTFKTTLINERASVDVTTGERVLIPAHYRISYIPDTQLAQTINEPFALFEGVELENDTLLANVGTGEEDDDNDEEIEVAEETPVVEQTLVIEKQLVSEVVEKQVAETMEEKPEEIVEKKSIVVIEKKPEIIAENKPEVPEVKEEIDPITEFAKISNPLREETANERPTFRAQRKRKRRFPWEWILCVLVLAGVGWFYHTVETKEKKENENIRAVFVPQKQVMRADSIEVATDSVAVVDTMKLQSSVPPMLLRNPAETPKTEEKKEEVKRAAKVPVIQTETPREPVVANNNTSNPKVRKITSGSTLRLIALEEYGNKAFWIYLYLENKDRIPNPNNVSVGTEIVIPPAAKYGIDNNSQESIRKANELARQHGN